MAAFRSRFSLPKITQIVWNDARQLSRGCLSIAYDRQGNRLRRIPTKNYAGEGNTDDRGQSLTGLPDSVAQSLNKRSAWHVAPDQFWEVIVNRPLGF
jgi:hypothetical protein